MLPARNNGHLTRWNPGGEKNLRDVFHNGIISCLKKQHRNPDMPRLFFRCDTGTGFHCFQPPAYGRRSCLQCLILKLLVKIIEVAAFRGIAGMFEIRFFGKRLYRAQRLAFPFSKPHYARGGKHDRRWQRKGQP